MGVEINPNLYPSGGYYFVEKDGTKITGPNWTAVERNVKQYRERKGLPAGDVHAEIMVQACANNPEICHQITGKVNPVQKPPSLKAKVFEWMANKSRQARQGPLDYVSDDEARARAAICSQCPKQKNISHLCSSCTASRAALRESIMVGRKSVAPGLEACLMLNLDLRAAIHLAEGSSQDPNLPENCWRRKG